ncbi:MAG: acyloxyacyl hydrolase [Candidatus Omnitrophica bacterium]|nr:acyloxyacyl hydrolase [Candidatus Omnitrophota bacterium]
MKKTKVIPNPLIKGSILILIFSLNRREKQNGVWSLFNGIGIIIRVMILAVIFSGYTSHAGSAEEPKKNASFYKSFSYFTGFAKGELNIEEDYKIIPSIFRFAFDMDKMGIGAADITESIATKFFSNPGLEVKGETEFLIETFINGIISPDSNIEVGFELLVKYAYPVTERINPYFFSGGGVIFMTQHTDEQSTQYNFIPQMGAGISYDLREDLSLDLEYRYRHLSNANRKLPNEGINVNMFLIGTTWKY